MTTNRGTGSSELERATRGVLGAFSGLWFVAAGCVVIVGLGVSWLVAVSVGGAGVAAPHWFYLPVLYAAARFGCRGALTSAVVAGLLAGPFLPLDVSAGVGQDPVDWITRAAFFVVIGQAMALVIGQTRASIAAEFERLQFEKELRAGITHNEIVLVYQPIVALASGEIIGVEALARWNHPERGLLSPCSFIPQAEESGLIVALGEHVLETGCQQLAAWRRGPLRHREFFRFAINVSPYQLNEPGFVDFVSTALHSHDLPPPWLHLEITETALVTDSAMVSARLDELKALGLAIAIDDFGTGHASLAYLHQFPIDVVKIDRSFTVTLGLGGRADSVSRALIHLAHSLNMRTIAEGVETTHQVDQLSQLGCNFAQGYHFSPPLPAQQLLPLLQTHAPYARHATTASLRTPSFQPNPRPDAKAAEGAVYSGWAYHQ